MKTKRAVKILFALLIMLFFVLVSKSINSVNAATFGPAFSHAYTMSGDWTAYCREHGKALGGDIGGIPITNLEYSQTSGKQQVEPATGYALYCGASGETLQHVIWYSKLWTGGGNSVVDGDSAVAGIDQRYKAYGDVYYGIIKPYKSISNQNKNLFTITGDTKDESVKVFINQKDKKYIVGPYKMKLNPSVNHSVSKESIKNPINDEKKALAGNLEKNDKDTKKDTNKNSKGTNEIASDYDKLSNSLMNNDSDTDYLDVNNLFDNNGNFSISQVAKQELYNELINKSSNSFAKFDITQDLQGINGDPNSFKFLDANGNKIVFPDFVNAKEFFIEFKPNRDGNIQYLGTPNIKIHWLDSFNYTVDGAWKMEKTTVEGIPEKEQWTILNPDQKPNEPDEQDTTQKPTWTKELKVQVPVHVGKSKTVGGFVTGTLYFKTSKCKEVTKTVTDSEGNPIVKHKGWELTAEDDDWILDTEKSTTKWVFSGGSSSFQRIDGQISQTTQSGTAHWGEANSNLAINKSCNVQIGGTVWLESPDNKTANIDGKLGTGDKPFAGIQVQLYDATQGNTAVVGGNGNQGTKTFYA